MIYIALSIFGATLLSIDICRQWGNLLIEHQNFFSHRTYFIEYEFPVAADYGSGQSDKKNVGLEITRIATKKTNAQSKYFLQQKYV